MGWTVTHKTPGTSVRSFFENQFNTDWPDGRVGRVIDCATFLHEAYIAFEQIYPDGRREVGAVVCLLKRWGDPYYNFGYKDMSEDMGPSACNCPERILNLLTPTDNKTSLEWRERCWQNVERRRNGVSLHKGLVIRFDNTIPFCGGIRENTFLAVEPKRLYFSNVSGTRHFRLRRQTLRQEPWQVVNS
ncbi:MAG: hypothetical protein NUW23_02560 [Firmicutes bacterium]|jgi:hypothetical protein|nr:hypothetical protein [Bacillota bacterium]